MKDEVTLCPNCGAVICEDDLTIGCWTCGFSMKDLRTINVKSEAGNEINLNEEEEDAEQKRTRKNTHS